MNARLAGAVAVLAGAFFALASTTARADQDIHGTVLVVLAKPEAGAVDPRVAQQPALHQPPFDAFHSMSVESSTDVLVGIGTPATVALPNGRTLKVELLEVQGSRLRVRASITRSNGRDYLPGVTVETDPGVPFVVAGQNYDGGTLVLLVTLGARPAPHALIAPGRIAPVGSALRPQNGPRPSAPPVAPPSKK